MGLGLRFSLGLPGRTIWIVDAHRDGKPYVVRAEWRFAVAAICVDWLT